MALQAFVGGAWAPNYDPEVLTWDAGTYLLNASGSIAALIFRCPKAGALDRFDFKIGTVTQSPANGLRASFQSVSGVTGLPSGTILGATNNAFVTYANPVATGWKSTTFGETVTVTRGQLVACVVDFPSFVASDSVTLFRATGGNQGFPYGVSGTTTKNSAQLPVVALHYTDGYAVVTPFLPGADTKTGIAFNVNSASADEWGMGFSVPFTAKLSAVAVYLGFIAAGADFEVLVYNSSDVVLATITQDGDVSMGSGPFVVYLDTELTLTANSTYRATIRPTTTNNVQVDYWTFQSAALMDTMAGGSTFYMTSRLNQAGSWTDYNSGTFRRPRMALMFSAFDDAVSTGSYAGGVYGA